MGKWFKSQAEIEREHAEQTMARMRSLFPDMDSTDVQKRTEAYNLAKLHMEIESQAVNQLRIKQAAQTASLVALGMAFEHSNHNSR